MTAESKETERCFSIELNSKDNLKTIKLSDGYDSVLVEGTIGKLLQAAFVDDAILEIIGDKGTFRINLENNSLTKPKQEVKQCKQ